METGHNANAGHPVKKTEVLGIRIYPAMELSGDGKTVLHNKKGCPGILFCFFQQVQNR